MNTDYEKIKADLLAFGKKNGACVEQYLRLYKAESIDEVIDVVKDNFWWCAKYRDFASVIEANWEQFAEHQIWVNQDVDIREGVGYLLATEGRINATSYGTSTINAKSCGTSTINATSYDTSTINATSYDTSTINATSYDTSTINATSRRSTPRVVVHRRSTPRVVVHRRSTPRAGTHRRSTPRAGTHRR